MVIQKMILVIVSMIMMFFSPTLCFADELVMKVAYQDTDGSPLIMGDGAALADPPGIGIDIVNIVAEKLGIKLMIERRPNKRVHAELQEGKFDASGFYSFKKERLEEGEYPMKNGELDKDKRVLIQGYYFYTLKNSNVTWDGKTITGIDKAVGANSGYSVVQDLKNLGIPTDEVETIKQNLEKLLAGRIQAYAAQDASLDPIIAYYERYKDIVKVGPPIKQTEYYFMFSHQFLKEHREIAQKFWEEIPNVRDSVIAKYKEMKLAPPL
jgi:polar amino acid transport system substrate-binding protein